MYNKGQGLPNKREIPLLEDVRWERVRLEFDKIKKRRLKRLYYTYLATALCAVILCISILFFGTLGGGVTVSDLLVEAIARLDLMNTSPGLAGDGGGDTDTAPSVTEGFLLPSYRPTDTPSDTTQNDIPTNTVPQPAPPLSLDNLYDFDYSAVPSGHTPIIPMDLSLNSYGPTYINNSTGLTPDVEALLNSDLNYRPPLEYLSLSSSSPTVLIIHTHGTEGYSEDGAISCMENGGDIARSTDKTQNVVAVGAVLCQRLNELGVPSLHCEVMHDEEQYRGAYSNAEKTIKKYLELYPTIQLVIDLHRDAIIKSSGEIVRPVTLVDGEATAQVMCVVGSSWGVDENPKWEGNLSLALKLRQELNAQSERLCRPVYLKSSTYNQEIAPYSLLLEIGAIGNSLEEATRAAEQVAESLSKIISKK